MATYSLFPGNPSPANVAGSDVDYCLGVRFESSVAGNLTHVRLWFDTANNNTDLQVGVWNADGSSLLASKTVSAPGSSGWVSVQLDTPVAIAASTLYAVGAVIIGGGYAFEGAVAWPRTEGPLSVATDGGRFIASSTLAFPTTAFNNNNYYIDLILDDAVSGPQFARPDADVSDGAWTPSTGADLFATIDETPASDADYNSTTSNSTFEVGLGTLATPEAGTQTFRVRAGGSPAKKLIARILEGGTPRATITVDPLTAAVAAYSATASGITDYSNLTADFAVSDATSPPTLQVTWGAVGTAASGTTSCTPAYPTGISAATSKLFCVVTGRSNTAATAPTMPAGWTNVLDFEGGTGTWGVDTGTRRVTIFQKDTTVGDETGTVTVSLAGTTANTLRASIHRVEVPSGYGIDVAASTGADTTNGTGYSATGSTNLSFQANDLLLIAVAQNIDTGTQSAQAITASGITFGTRTNRASTAVTNGNDHRHIIDSVPVSSGSGTVAPTYAYTISAAGSGPTGFLRLRAVAPTEFGRVTFAEFELPAASDGTIDLVAATAVSATDSSTPALTQGQALTVATASSASTASTPALTQAQQLAVDGASSATTASTPAVDSAVQLAAAPGSTATSSSTPAITQLHVLVPTSASSATAAAAVALTQGQQLLVDASSSSTAASTPAVGSAANLAAAPASTATALSEPTITVVAAGIDLVAAPAVSSSALSNVAVTAQAQAALPVRTVGTGGTSSTSRDDVAFARLASQQQRSQFAEALDYVDEDELIRRRRSRVIIQLGAAPAASSTALSGSSLVLGVTIATRGRRAAASSTAAPKAPAIKQWTKRGGLVRDANRTRVNVRRR